MPSSEHQAEQNNLEALLHTKQSNLELQKLLTTLPDRTKHPVMVPFGSVAFFPGHLIHTNECFVDIGEGLTVEKSAKETLDLLQQRQIGLDNQILKVSQQHGVLQHEHPQGADQPPKNSAVQSRHDSLDQILDIMEPFDERQHNSLHKMRPDHLSLSSQGQQRHAAAERQSVLTRKQASAAASSLRTATDMHAAVSTPHLDQPSRQPQSAQSSDSPIQLQSAHANAQLGSDQHHHSASNAEEQIRSLSRKHVDSDLSHNSPLQADSTDHGVSHLPQTLPQQSNSADEQHAGQQQACATDDGDFERMMAHFDELERQEAAQSGGASAGSTSGTALAAQSQTQAPKAATRTARTASKSDKPLSGLKRGFLSGSSRPKTTAATHATTSPSTTSAASPSTGNIQQVHSSSAADSDAAAFTGSIVEHLGTEAAGVSAEHTPVRPVRNASRDSGTEVRMTGLRPASGAAAIAGGTAETTVPRRVSKFKLARSAM